MEKEKTFAYFSKRAAQWTGRPACFIAAAALIAVWAALGPVFHYSDTWQLVINTGTTIVTFLMVFLIQNTQNRDTCAIQIKLDELIRADAGAKNAMLDLENLEEAELDRIRRDYEQMAKKARENLEKRRARPAASSIPGGRHPS